MNPAAPELAQPAWDALVESLQDAVFAVDEDLVVVWANPAACELCAVTPSEIVGRSLADFVPAVARLAAERHGMPSAAAILPRLAEELDDVHLVTPNGVTSVDVHAAEASTPVSELWSVTLRDVSEINASHATLLDAHRELEEFNRLAIGRELRMVELKREVNELLAELGRESRYDVED